MSVIISPPPNASNILSEFPCSLKKFSHGFNMNKKINHGSCSHGNHKLTMLVTSNNNNNNNNNNIHRIKIFFVVIKTNLSQQQP